jgi:sarcosine oxidase subunit alpha
MPRIHDLRDPVSITLDGEDVPAERGEPVAAALVAADRLGLARSPKFHRPRGPSCMRASCDGCLARVDGVPNVMTCRVAAAEGLRVETQNVVGSRETDLLRVTDWLFPEGMNHHELLAGVPALGRATEAIARRLTGIGELPAEPGSVAAARRRDVDVLVIGSGPAGMATALALAAKGRRVEVLDEDLAHGGSARILAACGVRDWLPLLDAFGQAVASSRLVVRTSTVAAGIYGADVLVADARGAEVITPRTLVLAPGAHDGALAFEGNDVPGVMSARAACALLARGVAVGRRAVILGTGAAADGDAGPYGDVAARGLAGAERVTGEPLRVLGSGRVRGVVVAVAGEERRLSCDAVLLDLPRAPAHELCVQAGAQGVQVMREDRGYRVRTGPGGRLRDGVHVAGEATGTPLDPGAIEREAEALAASA